MKMQNKTGLKEIGNKLPFSAPDHYFEDFALQMDVMTGVAQPPKRFMLAPWMYIAAMFLGLFILVNVFYKVHQKDVENSENYELYVLSQTDDMAIADYYLTSDDADTENVNK